MAWRPFCSFASRSDGKRLRRNAPRGRATLARISCVSTTQFYFRQRGPNYPRSTVMRRQGFREACIDVTMPRFCPVVGVALNRTESFGIERSAALIAPHALDHLWRPRHGFTIADTNPIPVDFDSSTNRRNSCNPQLAGPTAGCDRNFTPMMKLQRRVLGPGDTSCLRFSFRCNQHFVRW